MASAADRRWFLAGLLATALSALGWWFGSGLYPQWWLTWLAPLPVLFLATRVSVRWAVVAAFVAYFIGGLNQWIYLQHRIVLPMGVTLVAIGGPAVMLALCTSLFGRLVRQGRMIAATFAVPALSVALGFLNAACSPHGTFGNIAYTQMDALPLIQLAAVTGLWGIGFLLLLLPAALAVLSVPGTPLRTRLSVSLIVIVLLAATAIYGFCRLQASPVGSLRIGLVSLEKPIRPALHDPAGQALEQRYIAAIDRLAAAGAKAVVIPETSFATADATIPVFAELAARRDFMLDVGIEYQGQPKSERNMAMVFQPGASSPATYSKHHLIPSYEDRYQPSNDYTMLDGSPRIGLAVCKDMDFHDIGRAYGLRAAQVLLVPAWDFSLDGWLHSRMAIMRGVESGFAIARVARSGRLTLSDDRGRVVAEASSEAADAQLIGDLPLHQTQTLYTRWGDWFVWLDFALLAYVLWLSCWNYRRKPGG